MAAGTPTPWAQWLDAALAKRNWTVPDLARTGVVSSEATIYRWLRGDNPPKLVETVIEIAHLLHAPDAIAALEAAGMHRSADLIREARNEADEDPMIARIRNEQLLTEAEREAMIENYRQRNRETIHYFELQLAEAARRRHADRDRRTRRAAQ